MDDNKRNTALIATVVASIFCGLPGLCLCLFGGIFATAGSIPGADIDVFGSSDPGSAIGFGIGMICVSLFLIAIPAGVGFFTLRKKPEDKAINSAPMTSPGFESDPFDNDEPLPPTS